VESTPDPYFEARPPEGVRARGALVLLHAFPLSAAMWEPQFALANGGWHVVAPEIAPAPAAGRRRTMDDVAGTVIDLLDRLRIHEAVVAGLSMGGYAALAMFRLAPRYVHALILSDTRADADTPEAIENRRTLQRAARERGASAVADEMIPRLLGATTRATRPDLVERVRSLILASPVESIAGALDALMSRQDSTSLLPSIHCPTLILVGEEDAATPPVLSEAMHRAIAGSRLSVVPAAGHLSSLEQPEAFNRTVAEFLEHRV